MGAKFHYSFIFMLDQKTVMYASSCELAILWWWWLCEMFYRCCGGTV